ncbi:OsmC family protein [Streptomyces sp. NPDC018019]|uniref:OsmC family protein n=1 Tax=Streptomyces sp. NPDC018019 TaxID=3365030 RepID=UPI0037B63107
MSAHAYATHLRWDGSTAAGVRSYSRDHVAMAPPAGEVALSADPAFRGNPERLNPELLVVMAASSYQMLSFLAVAARAGVNVPAYDDEATSHLDLTVEPARLGAIHLAVTVTVAAAGTNGKDGADGPDEAEVRELAEQAHRECYIANSLSVPVEVTTTVVTA